MTLKQTLEATEKRLIQAAITEADWNVTRAAARLGCLRTTLWMKLKKYGIKRPYRPKTWRRF